MPRSRSSSAWGLKIRLRAAASSIASGRPSRQTQISATARALSSDRLTVQIGVADIAAGGPAGVTVFNPGPGGGISNAAEFAVAAPGENPIPSIAHLSPSKVMTDVASASTIVVLIDGTNFIADSQAQWNGANRPTAFVSSTQLKLTVTAADLALGGQGSVTVVNPGPGGGASNTATFTIITIQSRTFVPMIRR